MINADEGFSRSYRAISDSVPSVRRELTQFAAEVGAEGDRLEAIRLAASEAVTNGILHATTAAAGRSR